MATKEERPAAASRSNDASRVDEFINWLEASPPYEQIGKVVVASSELDLNLIGLALELGIDPQKVWYRDKRLKFLRSSGDLPTGFIDRVAAVTESRDLLSHGVWMQVMEQGQAFLRPDKQDPGQRLQGRLVTNDELTTWREEFLELSRVVEAARRKLAGGTD